MATKKASLNTGGFNGSSRTASAPASLEDMKAFASKLQQNPQQARDFFQKAGILTESGHLTKQYRD